MLNANPLITIYITNCNYDKYLNKAIASVLAQTYKKIEIIIVDDNSKDKSKKILKDHKKNKLIKIIFNKKRMGLIKSSNLAIKNSKGKYFLRLDADDYLHKDAIKKMYSIAKKNPRIALVFPDFFQLKDKKNLIRRYKYNHKKYYNIYDPPAHGACSLINKKIFMKIGKYNEKFDRQDGFYIWYMLLLNKFKIKHCKLPLFYYRDHKKNLTKNMKKILKTRIKIINYFFSKKFKNNNSFLEKIRENTLKTLKLSKYE